MRWKYVKTETLAHRLIFSLFFENINSSQQYIFIEIKKLNFRYSVIFYKGTDHYRYGSVINHPLNPSHNAHVYYLKLQKQFI